MFRIAPIVLFATSLCSVATAQAADLAIQKQEPANGNVNNKPSANGNVTNEPIADGTVTNEPSANGNVANEPTADGTVTNADVQPKPVDKPLPIDGLVYLELSVDDMGLRAFVHGAEAGFVGVVGLSLNPNLTHSFTGLPPLLTDAVVIAYGFTRTQDLELKAPLSSPAEAIMVYGQAIILDEQGPWASGIVPLMIGKGGNGTDQATEEWAVKDRARAAKAAAELAREPAIN